MLSIQMLDIGHVIFIDENKFEKAEAFCAECPDFVQITLKLANSNEDLRWNKRPDCIFTIKKPEVRIPPNSLDMT